MTKEGDLSAAELSRRATKAALARQAEEKKKEEERQAKEKKWQEEESARRQVDIKREAIPIGERLFFLLWAKIKEREEKGFFKLELTFHALLGSIDKKLLEKTYEQLACLVLNHAAEKLRVKKFDYKVRFGRDWGGHYYIDPQITSNRTSQESGTTWGEDASDIPHHHSDRGRGYESFEEAKFLDYKIEVSWEEESK